MISYNNLISLLVIAFCLLPSQGFRPIIQRGANHGASTRLFIFDRIARVITSNVNGVLKKLEDPEKVIEQAVMDMQNDLIKIRQSYAEVSATQKRMERQLEQAENDAASWYKRAQLALQKGDDELAREALSRRQVQVDIAENLKRQITIQADAIEKLYTSMQALEQKIVDAKRQKEALIARARTAKTSMQVNDMISTLKTSSSMEAFERMKDKVESLETQAQVASEMAVSSSGSSVGLEERFKALEGNTQVEDELQKMKRMLPPPRVIDLPSLPSSSSELNIDMEYEKLKQEIRRRE